MNIKLFDLLNEDTMKKNRFNYSLILNCIENMNHLNIKGFFIIYGINNDIYNLLCMFNQSNKIILVDNKIENLAIENIKNNNINNCDYYIIQSNLQNIIDLPIYYNDKLTNMFSFIYFNKSKTVDNVKKEFDFFKDKVVINGIILFDNIDSYDHMECLDNYIKQFNFEVFTESNTKIAYCKQFSSIKIISLPKTGTSTIHHNIEKKYISRHNHSLNKLKYDLNHKNKLIIVGVRNPIDRNISEFFQNINFNSLTDLEIKKNNYRGEFNYICDFESLFKKSTNEIIDLFFNHDNLKNIHFIFNDWFYEFFDLIDIKSFTFNKQKGFQFYHLKNNNTLLVYTLEKLNDNLEEFKTFFNLDSFPIHNDGNNKYYKDIYNDFKKNISFTHDYKNKLLNTNIMNIFYTSEQIQTFYDKYPTQN